MKTSNIQSLLLITIMSIYTWQAKASCRIDTTYIYSFDTISNAKEVNSRYIYSYAAFDSIAQFLAQSWDPTNAKWVGIIKRDRNYNTNNLLKEEIVSSWDATTAAFLPYTQEILTYNGSNQHTKSDINSWDATTSTWENGSKKSFSYNGQGKQTEEIEELWNSTTATWRNFFQLTYTYNTSGDMDTMRRNGWDMASSKWYDSDLFFYNYNSSKQLIEDYWFENDGVAWIQKELNEYSYNLNGTLKKKTLREWDDMAGVYSRGDDVLYTYSANGDLVYEDIFFDWRVADNKHKKHTQLEHICAKTGVGISTINSESGFKAYPNPVTTGALKIAANIESQYTLVDISGKQVLQGETIIGENSLDFSPFAKGIYLLNIGSNKIKIIYQ